MHGFTERHQKQGAVEAVRWMSEHNPAPQSSARRHPMASTSGSTSTAAVLYWIPLGAGGHSVRFNGVVYETISAIIQRRPRSDIYHCALHIRTPSNAYAVEMTPVPNRPGWERGVVAEGPVGTRWAGRLRLFRYEVRCWHDGIIPDLQYAVGGPIRLTDNASVVQRFLAVLPSVPALTWGRDESRVGDMWSCNSIISWALTRAGLNVEEIPMPSGGRAPGWHAGISVAQDTARPRNRATVVPTISVPKKSGPMALSRRGRCSDDGSASSTDDKGVAPCSRS
jgi:hypothetical protein